MIVGLLAASALAGCTSPPQPTVNPTIAVPHQSAPAPLVTYSGDVPTFTGPWADMFSSAYRHSTTDKQRQALSDNVVTAQEYSELRNDFVGCVGNYGGKVTLAAGGGFTVELGSLTSEQVDNDVVPTCEAETVGYVGALYEQLTRNPDRQDEGLIVVQCLRDARIVGAAYSPAQYAKDLSSNSGLNWNDPAVLRCGKDPLGTLTQ